MKYIPLFLLILVCSSSILLAEGRLALNLKPRFSKHELAKEVYFLTDSAASYTLEDAINSNGYQLVTEPYINFRTDKYVRWLRFSAVNNSPITIPVNLLTKGIDSVDFYVVHQNKLVKSIHSGSHVPVHKRDNTINSLLLFPFDLPIFQEVTIYVRIRTRGYPLSAYPFTLLHEDLKPNVIKSNTLFQSIYLGGTTVVFLFGLFLALLFRQRIYVYYACFVLGSFVMMLLYNEYHYFFFETLPQTIKDKNAFAILVTVNSAFYLLFAREYLLYGRSHINDLLIKITIILTAISLVGATFLKLTLFDYRYFFYIFLFAMSSLFFVMLIKSLRNNYKPAWLFLIGSMPIAFLGFVETTSAMHSIPIQKLHEVYYFITLWDMCFLTLGLVWRFKLMQDEQQVMQEAMFSMEIRVQENERGRIARDLHDRLGGLFAVLKLNLGQISLKNDSKERELLDKSLNVTDMAANELRQVAHRMEDHSLTNIGLVNLLNTLYGDAQNPSISIQTSGMEKRLPTVVEAALYNIIQESITNSLKHAEATEIVVQLTRTERAITLIIEDDGIGFDLTKTQSNGKGITNMMIRSKEHLQGDIRIDTSPGNGTVIIVKAKLNK